MKKLSRILCLLLALLLLEMPFVALPGAAASAEPKDIDIKNAGFEETENGWLKHWTHMDTQEAEFSVDTTKQYSGASSVLINNVSANNPWVSQGNITGLVEGAMYAVSVFVNVDLLQGDGAGTKIEFYDANGNGLSVYGGSHSDVYPYGRRIPSTNNRWQEHVTIFKIPKGAAVAKVYVRLFGIGKAWFDDITFTYSGAPDAYTFDTSRVFYYKEHTEGKAYVKLNDFYLNSDTEKDTRIDFELISGTNVIAKAENVKFENMEAWFTYPLSDFTPYKPCTVACKIKDKDGKVLEEHTRRVYVVDRPTVLNEEGHFVIDGKLLNPNIAYHVNTDDFAKVKEAGLNMVMLNPSPGADLRFFKEGLEEHNLYAVIALYQMPMSAGNPEIIEDTKMSIEAWRDVPNVIGYATLDEPFLVGDSAEIRQHSEDAYLLIRELDPDRAVVIADKRNDTISAQYCDTYILDSYAKGKDTSLVTSDAIGASAATEDKNGFWELAATYDMPNATANSARNSIYRAFEEGARGIGYFSFSDAMKGREGYENKQQIYHWEEWDAFCTFNNEEVPILFDRFVNGEAIAFNEFDDGQGKYSMKWFDWFVGDNMYLVAHNRAKETQTVTIPLKSANGKVSVGGFKAEPIGLTTQDEVKGKNAIELTLGAEEIALYKITPDKQVDLSKVNEPAESEKVETPTEDGLFSDLAGYDWAKEAIESLYEDGIVTAKEEGIYAPGEAITRLDFVSALVRALGLTEEGEAFPDCDAAEIKIARAAGITNGDTDGNFRPYDTITRQDIMTTAVRALNAGLSEAEIPEFSDWNLVSDYALEAVQVMTQAGVIKGNGDGTLNPLGNATRAEAAVMLERMLGTEFTEKPDPSEIREEIEFTSKVEETTLQKWSDAADLIKGLGIAEPVLETSVTKGDFEAAVSNLLGTNYDAFAENNKAITYEEAVEALVKLLGYEAYAASRGGYMAMAAQLDLTKGLAPETYMRGGELCVLLENAIEIKMAERTGYGETESYRETEDTLLSAYRNIYKHKGTVEGDYYTNSTLKKGEILLDGEVFVGGEGYFKQRVVAYAEHTKDDKNILYVKPANDTEVITADTKEILEADASKIRVDGNGGKDKIYSISGAEVYVNGEKKTTPTGADLRPDMGTVSIISSGGTVTAVLIEKYENRIVESVYAEENTVYFKNAKELVLDAENDRFHMDFDLKALKEWNVLSVMFRDTECTKVYKVIVSSENVQGTPSETSADGILLGDAIYPPAKTVFGTPMLGTEAVFYLDFNGKVAAVNDEGVTREYGYFTTMTGGKGLGGALQIRIFTKNGKMIVFPAADNLKLNGEPITEEKLLADARFFSGKDPIGQLIVYEVNEQGEITEIQTAIDAIGLPNSKQPDDFAKAYMPTGNSSTFHSGKMNTLGNMFRISNKTVTFLVPAAYSQNEDDYKIIMGTKHYTHNKVMSNLGEMTVYDWDDNFFVGAVVQKTKVENKVEDTSSTGMFVSLGQAVDDEGLTRTALRILDAADGKERVYYADADLTASLDAMVLTDVDNPNETEKTGSEGTYTLNTSMQLSALNPGDMIQYAVNGAEISAMRVLLRAKSPKIGETSTKKLQIHSHYASLVTAFGPVEQRFDDGISMTPGDYERMFLVYNSGGEAEVVIMDMKTGKYKFSSIEGIQKGDMVFCARTTMYQHIMVVYK